jgi:hypothetical protein
LRRTVDIPALFSTATAIASTRRADAAHALSRQRHDLHHSPDGRKQTILSVPHYDFNWQLGYCSSIKVPKGTVLHVDAHFDNSSNNKFNPNPNKTVITVR